MDRCLMHEICLILFIFIWFLRKGFYCSSVLTMIGVSQRNIHLYSPRKDFTCFDGSQTIPYDWVNDDYCDCKDGSDEPSTSACVNSVFHCANSGYYPLEIPSSRVNDGICDCCDGTDEYFKSVNCSNTCLSLKARALAEMEQKMDLINEGNLIRQTMIERGKEIRLEKEVRLLELEAILKDATEFKSEVGKLKSFWEEKQKELMELSLREGEELKYNQELEISKRSLQAKDMFNEMDLNRDLKLQANEILIKLKSLEICEVKIKSTLEEEAMYIMNMKSEIAFDDFLQISWNRFKTILDINKSTNVIPPQEEITPIVPNNEEIKFDEQYQLNEGTKIIINETINARDLYEKCDKDIRDIENKIGNLKFSLQIDYGPEDEFLPLEGDCFTYSSPSYNYTLCPFDLVYQTGKNGGSKIKLGVWKKWETHPNYTCMLYDEGEECWNGPKRSARVFISCGIENDLYSADEPDKCVYELNFRTPAACTQETLIDSISSVVHDEL